MKHSFLLASVLVLLTAVTTNPRFSLAAAEYKPLVVCCLSNYERLVKDLGCLSDPRLMVLVANVLGQVYGTPVDPVTLAPIGLETRKPWGLVVETDGQTFPIYGFIPVTDLGRLLAGSVTAGKIKPPEEGVYEIKFADRMWYVRQKGGWAMFASTPLGLDTTPADPVKVLNGLHKSCDIGIRFSPERLPTNVRDLAKRWLKEGHRLVVPRKPGQPNLEAALYSALANQGLQLAALAVDEGDALTVGASMDVRARMLVADAAITYKPDTEMDQSLKAPSKTKTSFGGFSTPQAALTGVWTGEIARMPLYQVLTLFDSVVEQLLPGAGNRAVADLWRTIREALLAEDVDGGVSAVLRPNEVTLLVGGYVADTAALQQKLETLADAAGSQRTNSGAPTWKLDAARHQNVRLHLLSIPIPKDAYDRRKLVRMFGDSLEVVVGIGEHALYVAAGKNPLEALKHALRSSKIKSSKKPPPVHFSLVLGTLMRFSAETSAAGDRQQTARLAGLLEQSGGRDHIRLMARPVERGMHVRLEVEEGVLRALAANKWQ